MHNTHRAGTHTHTPQTVGTYTGFQYLYYCNPAQLIPTAPCTAQRPTLKNHSSHKPRAPKECAQVPGQACLPACLDAHADAPSCTRALERARDMQPPTGCAHPCSAPRPACLPASLNVRVRVRLTHRGPHASLSWSSCAPSRRAPGARPSGWVCPTAAPPTARVPSARHQQVRVCACAHVCLCVCLCVCVCAWDSPACATLPMYDECMLHWACQV